MLCCARYMANDSPYRGLFTSLSPLKKRLLEAEFSFVPAASFRAELERCVISLIQRVGEREGVKPFARKPIKFHAGPSSSDNDRCHSYTCRAGYLGFAVLRCISKSYFQAILTIKAMYLWARYLKITYPKSNSLNSKCGK